MSVLVLFSIAYSYKYFILSDLYFILKQNYIIDLIFIYSAL